MCFNIGLIGKRQFITMEACQCTFHCSGLLDNNLYASSFESSEGIWSAVAGHKHIYLPLAKKLGGLDTRTPLRFCELSTASRTVPL